MPAPVKRLKKFIKDRPVFFSREFHKHPFAVPVFTLIALVLLAAILFVNAQAVTVGADDTRIVQLTIDGQRQVIPTRAQTVSDLLKRLNITVGEFDVVEPAPTTLIAADDFRINMFRARPVTIVDSNGEKKQTFSAQPTPRLIAQKAGFKIIPEDNVEIVQPEETGGNTIIGAKIQIERARHNKLSIYGNLYDVLSHASTVGELLAEKHIVVSEGDNIQPGLETPLTPDVIVFISSAGKRVEVVEETIEPIEETVLDPNLSSGTIRTEQQGNAGRKVVTYEIDAAGNRRELQVIVLQQAVRRIITKGTRPLFADYSPEGIPSRVFCGSPHQRNWKNINTQNAAIGRTLAAQNGWTGGEFNALLELFACESSWTETAGNPYSGAYGIPQAWPGSKMSTAGEDWYTNPKTQIIWGLDYIKRVYGSPSKALAKHYSSNYY